MMPNRGRKPLIGVLAAAVCGLVVALPSALAAPRPQANLGLGLTGAPLVVNVGDQVTYTATVRNFGPADASAVTLRNLLPARSELVSVSASQGSCSGTRPVLCQLGPLARGASATVSVVAKPTRAGTLVDQAWIAAPGTRDRHHGNDHQVVSTRVLPPVVTTTTTSTTTG
jgi:uncharacterized repeat protein (TIGR01451 family)